MKRVLIFAAFALVFALFGFVILLNPGRVDFRLTQDLSTRPQLGLLLVTAFVAGVLISVSSIFLWQLGRHLTGWRERRRARQALRVDMWHQSGTALAWGGELERSRGLLKKAWKRQPRNHAAALALASSYMDTGEYLAAQQTLEVALADDANNPDLRFALGEALRANNNNGEAIKMLETVRVQFPRAPRVLISLRELYREAGRWREAARIQETYVQTLSDGGRATEGRRLLRLRYQAAMALEDPQARAEALEAVMQADPSFVPAIVSSGDALVACQRVDEAKKLWEKGFRSQVRLVFIERLLAHQTAPRDRERTVALMNKYGQQLDADSVHLLTAQLAMTDSQFDAAATELEAVQRQDAPHVQRCWAELYHMRGQQEKAWVALRRVADEAGAIPTGYHCTSCGRLSEVWTGYCPRCERWDTYRSGTEA